MPVAQVEIPPGCNDRRKPKWVVDCALTVLLTAFLVERLWPTEYPLQRTARGSAG